MPFTPGDFYIHEKLSDFREHTLEKRQRAHRLAATARSPRASNRHQVSHHAARRINPFAIVRAQFGR